MGEHEAQHHHHEGGDECCQGRHHRHGGHRRHGEGHGEGHCGCGGRGMGAFKRRYLTREEKIARLEEYLKELQSEAKAVEERLAELRG